MWQICFWMSVVSVAVAVAISVFIDNTRFFENYKYNLLKWLFGGVFVAVCFLNFPISIPENGSMIEGIFLSPLNSIDVFKGGCDYGSIVESMTASLGNVFWYKAWVLVLLASGPVLAVGVIATLFINISAYLRCITVRSRDLYVFSEINGKSLSLASDIKKKRKKAVIVFTNALKSKDEKEKELLTSTKKLGAICFKSNIANTRFKHHSCDSQIFFFAIGADESENLNQSIKVIEKYKYRKNTNVYVFSTSAESELLLTSVDKGEIKLRRINESKALINRVLYEHGQQIFDNAIEGDDGLRHISAVVVGMGSRGTEMMKALSWFCQMDGYTVRINAFDRDELAEERFSALAPDLMSDKYRGINVPGEAQYDICIHSGVDVETKSFADKISNIKDATYVIVSLGSDDLNIKTSVNLRMYFERINIRPVIQAVVSDFRKSEALQNIENFKKQKYNIEFIGNVKTSFTEDVIVDSELEADALRVHLKWGIEEEFWKYEYNYQSSVASAIHMKARVACGIPGADKKEEDLTARERDIIGPLEHRRWNAYMRAEGYIYSEKRNDLAKTHSDLKEFVSLSEEKKLLDSKVGTK